MADLYSHNRKIDSVFQLLGKHENDISYSVAWALAQSPTFLKAFLQNVIDQEIKRGSDVSIRLQQYEGTGGITDIEIESANQFYLILEAKRGWNLPSREQLELYAKRPSFRDSKAVFKRILVLSECSRGYAELHLKVHEVADVPIKPLSWRDIALLATKTRSKGSHAEKRLLNELLIYLRGLMTMQNIDSNWVYVVALAQGKPRGWGISWIDIVRKCHRYFHPVGGGRGGWPKDPANYIAFRYYGKLQSIHHIEGYEIVTNMHDRIPEIPSKEWAPHFLYTLGPEFGPSKEVRTGNIYPKGHVWCMLDTLFTCNTISDARDRSKERAKQGI